MKDFFKSKKNKAIAGLAALLIIILVGSITYSYLNRNTPTNDGHTGPYTNSFVGIQDGDKITGLVKVTFDAEPSQTSQVDFLIDDEVQNSEKVSLYSLGGGDNTENLESYDTIRVSDGNHVLTAKVYGKDGKIYLTKSINISIDNKDRLTSGLNASYFLTENLTGNATKKVDPNIDFDWQRTKENNSSIRWEGYFVPKYSENYTFSTLSDDGVRITINGNSVIDDWSVHYAKEDKKDIYLQKGRYYVIKVEYFEHDDLAVMKLFWESKSQSKQAIPADSFYRLK